MTGQFAMDINFDDLDETGLRENDPTLLVGIRYLVDGENILRPETDEPRYVPDYFPFALKKWLRYIRSVSRGKAGTYKFTEDSVFEFLLEPDENCMMVTVVENDIDEIRSTHRMDIKQFAGTIIDAADQYHDRVINQQPELDSNKSLQELQRLSEEVSDELKGFES